MVLPEGVNILPGAVLAGYTSLNIGGKADYLARINTRYELSAVLNWAAQHSLPVTVIGRGSKLLVSDRGVRGVVITLPGLNSVERSGNILVAGAGASLVKLAKSAIEWGLEGLEWATGIPATVGGAVTMNAGAFLGSMSDVVESVEFFDGREFVTVGRDGCGFGYRQSIFAAHPNYIITAAKLELRQGNAEELFAAAKKLGQRRSATQPIGLRTAGSTFKRPEGGGLSAGELIEQAGLKGYTIGGAEVSVLHANFIINRGGAKSADVLALMQLIQDTVKTKFGVMLEPEIKTIGEF